MIWLLHGNLGLPTDWKPVADLLIEAGFSVRCINLWSYLQSPAHQLEDVGRCLAEEALKADCPPILCGYSMGGRLALHALRHAPHAWKAGVLVSTNPGLCSAEEKQLRLHHDQQWAQKCRTLPWTEFLREWNNQGVLQGCPTVQGPELELQREFVARGFESWSLGLQDDFRRFLAQAPLPILGIAGEKDAKFSRLAREVWGEKAVLIPGVGHRVPLEAPELLADTMISWTAQLN
jgi:2-succinyl-6-hydroxy-2,4-cyclohexadiene-1-carboxylate synthase